MHGKSNLRIFLGFACVIASGLIVRTYVFSIRIVEGSSMAPNLQSGDVVFVNMWRKNFTPGEIVIFKPAHYHTTLIKRVLAGPESIFFIEDYKTFINNKMLLNRQLDQQNDILQVEEVNTHGKNYFTRWKFDTLECRYSDQIKSQKDEYILIGDNRCESGDSRVFGPIHKDHILGIVMTSFSL